MFIIKSILGIFIAGVFGAIVSKQINLGNLPWWSTVVSATLSGLVWGWMVSQKKNLVYTSVLYDALMAITYILVLIFLGEKLTLIQFLAITLAIVGIILVNS